MRASRAILANVDNCGGLCASLRLLSLLRLHNCSEIGEVLLLYGLLDVNVPFSTSGCWGLNEVLLERRLVLRAPNTLMVLIAV